MSPRPPAVFAWLVLAIGSSAACGQNVLFFTADDMHHDSPAVCGGPIADLTPHVDRLAAQGLRFERAYSTVAVCQPVRQTMFCGLYPHRSGSLGFRPVRPGVRTLNQQLRDAGYLISRFGKGKHMQPAEQFCCDVGDDTISRHPTRLAEATRAFIRMAKARGKPFFHNVNCYDPHRPFIGMRGPDDLAGGEPPSRRVGHDEITAVPGFLEDLPDVRRELAGYYTNVRRLDDALGAVLAVLDEEGVADSTIVVFYGGDHGMSFPFAKSNCYEASSRGTLIVRWPGVTKPDAVDRDHMVTTLDFTPTLLDALGLPAIPDIDGRSFLPALRGRATAGWDRVFTQYNAAYGDNWLPMRCLRTRDRAYIWNAWSDGRKNYHTENMAGLTWKAMLTAATHDPAIKARTDFYALRAPEEFYDLSADRFERTNLIASPVHQAEIESLRAELLAVMRRTEDPFADAFANRTDRRLVSETIEMLARKDAQDDRSADVIVYGATPAGVCAAIGAAREGATVLLVEPTAHVGGVNTGGLAFSDSNQMDRTALRGLFEEFHERIEADYRDRGIRLPYAVATKDQRPWTYEPHVAARVTRAMLAEAGVPVLTRQALARVEKAGARITSLTTVGGGSFTARTFVDATYEGDLLAAAGVTWVLGREGRGEFGESLAGRQYPKPPLAISGLDVAGDLLPLVTTRDAGTDEEGDRTVMTYSFRLCLTTQAENRVPFPEPDSYDPARFEVVRRYFAQEQKPGLLWDLYPLPGDKSDANNAIGRQFSLGLVGGGNGWCEADPRERARIWERHRQYTLELYRFLTTDPAVPRHLRDELARYGLCKDEFADTGHWPPQLYVREGRRMRGDSIMTQADILDRPAKDDAVAVVSFPIDSHDCRRIARGDAEVINEGTIFPKRLPGLRRGPAYQVPYRAITPRAEECVNLLVPVAISATHVAFSSIRVEPAWMVIGHSAGIAAALAAKDGRDVQQLDYSRLRARLLAQRQVVDLAATPR